MLTAALSIERALPALKWAWVALVSVGVLGNLATLREAWIDYRLVKRAWADEAANVQAWCSLREQIVFLAFQGGVLWVRAWALLWPDPRDPQFAAAWATDATVITALQLLLAYNCVLDFRDRRRVIRQLYLGPSEPRRRRGLDE
jgi:hypothetical protein